MMPSLLINPDGIIFLLTKEHSSVFPFQWICGNEFSVLVCLKIFLFHLHFWGTVSQAIKFSVASYFLSAFWRYCFLILQFLFFRFSAVYIIVPPLRILCCPSQAAVRFFLVSCFHFCVLPYDLVCYCSSLNKKSLVRICILSSELISPLVMGILILITKCFLYSIPALLLELQLQILLDPL